MLVPRSYRYTAAPPMRDFDEKVRRRSSNKAVVPKHEEKTTTKSHSPQRSTVEPTRAPTPPVDVPTPERTPPATPHKMPRSQSRTTSSSGRKGAKHDPNALPPAVAALLAVTQIPRHKPNTSRRRPTSDQRISIDELVSEWKSDDSLQPSYSSSPTLSMLLEDNDEEDQSELPNDLPEEGPSYQRSTSLESVPSLEEDDRSMQSSRSLSTPGSLRSARSYSNLKKDKQRSLPASVECASEHPLVPKAYEDEFDDSVLLATREESRPTTPKPKSSFKSNLTTSFQALKNAFSSFSVSSVSPSQRSTSSAMSDDMLWSHPFLFPRFSPEVRPAIEGTPTQAQRRYLNPLPLTFEEQEAPYQLALHAPFLSEPVEGAPTIQMQTYSRGRRKASSKRSTTPDPQSEAGRALAGATGVRQREPRENSNFLRVVVLEMNMRREGKLEYGRAKIWLPPRQVSPSSSSTGRVPKRWVGVSAY